MDALGTELPRRTVNATVLLGAAAVLALPTAAMAREAAASSGGTAVGAWAMTAVMALLLVAAPALLARGILVRRTYVSPDAVSVTRKGRLHVQVAFADLTEVKVRVSGSGGDALRNERVLLIGPPRVGPGRGVMVSRFQVRTLRPLLDRLGEEVARRPELLADDLERSFFTRALQTAP